MISGKYEATAFNKKTLIFFKKNTTTFHFDISTLKALISNKAYMRNYKRISEVNEDTQIAM